MAETLSSTPKVWQHRNRNQRLLSWFLWLIGTAIFMYCWQIVSDSTTWFFVWDAPRIATDIGSRMIPPRWSYIGDLLEPL
ncbi:MAG: phosphonate ABC transporter, permease protein PhnE, partial [SAR324 cluster bacterium]|nr:phosphonate ABC transporter, permease protein PhnE [SAR324 cluster bacterium]